jgi:eukaryotic-like serine/threonine-protein kinase
MSPDHGAPVSPESPAEGTPLAGPPPDDPRYIGPYHLLRVLGQGGMGVVYEAEQSEPVRRRVALKIIKLGLDTREFVARFETERQALAVMSHPNIARIHDGGSTETGRPYFVMELVHGVPITEYCDANRLSVRERLDLFLAVCAGVHHAHQKGVIHRDLKPSNVLVALEGDRPVPKVIDFGVAKTLGPRLTDHTLVTELGRPMGTPEYMSPEQAEASVMDVDTRTDIYSLGVMLYEMLVGALPIDVAVREARGGITRFVVRETDAPKPSRRFESLRGSRQAVADRRRTEQRELLRELRSDLDWIVMRAIEKDRTRRYDSVTSLAGDIERHLQGQPVLARPPTLGYRAGKFVRRHWAGTAAAAIAVLALAAGAAAATIGLVRARAAEHEARLEAETARQVTDFVVDLFRISEPGEAMGSMVTAREILDRGAIDIRGRLGDQPVVRSRMMAVMGAVYLALGLYDQAEPLLTEALVLQRDVLGPGHRDVAGTLLELAELARVRGAADDARSLAEEALAIAVAAEGPDHLQTGMAHQRLGEALRDLGEYDEARRSLDRAVEIRQRLLGPDDNATLAGLAQVGWLNRVVGDFQGAREIFERVLEVAERQLPSGHPHLAGVLSDLGVVLSDLGELEQARGYYERALAIRQETLGPQHLEVAASLNNLGALEWRAGNLDASQEHYEASLRVYEAVLGPESDGVARTVGNLALLHHSRGDYREARGLYERAIAIGERIHGPDHGRVTHTLNNYGWLLRSIADFANAQRVLERALAAHEAAVGPESANLIGPHTNLAFLFRDLGDYDRARHHAERAAAIARATYPPGHTATASAIARLGNVMALQGAYDEALPVLEEALEAVPGSDEAVFGLAVLHHRNGDRVRADSLFGVWLDLMAAERGRETPRFPLAEAAVAAMRGDRRSALGHLETAVARGYSDPWFVRHYALIDLRGDPRYAELGEEVMRRAGLR